MILVSTYVYIEADTTKQVYSQPEVQKWSGGKIFLRFGRGCLDEEQHDKNLILADLTGI